MFQNELALYVTFYYCKLIRARINRKMLRDDEFLVIVNVFIKEKN